MAALFPSMVKTSAHKRVATRIGGSTKCVYTRDLIVTPISRNELAAAALGADSYAYDYDNIGNCMTKQKTANNIKYEANAHNRPACFENPSGKGYDVSLTATMHKEN